MYSYCKTNDGNATDFQPTQFWFDILNPEGDVICQVASEGEAADLISHLNR